jgi:hypothetical protein
MAAPIDIELENLKVYGRFLALDITGGQIHQGVGQGKVVARGFEVINYASGPVIEEGEDLLFREGTQIKFAGGGGAPEIVFVEMGDVIAQVKEAAVAGTQPGQTPEGKPA